VNLFFRIVDAAARTLGRPGLYDPFVQESHHRGKVDAPSGTARRLAAIVIDADPRFDAVLEGHPEGRIPPGTLQVVSTRAGAEPGTHRVGFDGPHDLIALEHRARGREGLALGAVLAAEWLEGRSGMHGFDEVLDAILRGDLRVEGESE
jgi:4-hydroxy-tetrahydrodipicolinate reductase